MIVSRSSSRIGPAVSVPFLDLSLSHMPLVEEILEDLAQLLESGAFTNGPHVAAFEHAFAAYCGTDHCVGTASGLDALEARALGSRPPSRETRSSFPR